MFSIEVIYIVEGEIKKVVKKLKKYEKLNVILQIIEMTFFMMFAQVHILLGW